MCEPSFGQSWLQLFLYPLPERGCPNDGRLARFDVVHAFLFGAQHVHEALCKRVSQSVSNRGLFVRLVGLVLVANLPAGNFRDDRREIGVG